MSTGKTVAKSDAFSFIELIIVISVITVLSTGAFIILENVLDSSRHSTAENQVSSISTAIAQYKFETGLYPSSLEELTKPKGKYLSLIHISEPTRQEAISYAVFCLKKKKQ